VNDEQSSPEYAKEIEKLGLTQGLGSSVSADPQRIVNKPESLRKGIKKKGVP